MFQSDASKTQIPGCTLVGPQVFTLENPKNPSMHRLKAFGSKSAADVEETVRTTLPEGLAYAYNLGHVDVFPATSGKENAARYLMGRFDASPASSFLLCDDDNDLGARSGFPGSRYLGS